MPDLSRLPGGGKLLLASGVAVIVAALVVLAVVRPWSSDRKAAEIAPPAAGDRLLQSVSVAMQSDGSLSQVGDTVVISRASGQTDTSTSEHDPRKVVNDLPVRVVPSYRTATSSGTNLSDLDGYTGRVTIDLQVQNLTVRPQQVSYDAGGQSRTSTAMVGAPLTVVASASLPGVDPATVVTPSTDASGATDPDVTNGVLSRSSQQVPQVQWAAILAPPQLAATATLRLVLDAKDFTVPTVDVSVQPGLVTDPSVGALVDAAFNPKNSDELALQSRTIAVIGDVNDVLTRASSQISKVRKTLDSTSTTLGAKTVVALQQNTKQIDSSLKDSDRSLGSLDKALQSSLKSTSSSTLQQLESTVRQVEALLGDTSAPVPTATVTGDGCDAKVSAPVATGTVYGSLLQVSAQLNAYSSTTLGCRDELQKAISDTIGPADPSKPDACPADAAVVSVTCSLAATRDGFAAVSASIRDAQKVTDGLDPEKDFDTSRATVDDLIKQLNSLVDGTSADPTKSDTAKQLAATNAAIVEAEDSLKVVGSVIGDIHTAALANKDDVDSMVAQNQAAADAICPVIGDGTQPGTLTARTAERIRSFLVARSCPDANGDTTALTPPAPYTAAMSTRLQKQSDAWSDLAEETDPKSTDDDLAKALTATTDALTDARKASDAATASVADLNAAARKSLEGLDSLASGLGDLEKKYSDATAALDESLADAAKNASTASLDDAIKTVSDQGQASSQQLGKAFTSSAAGLSSAAKALQDNGAAAIDQQRTELDRTQQTASRSLTTTTTASLGRISGDVTSATRDLTTTRQQLTRDLANILLDLGNPNVKGSGVIGTVAKGATAAGAADYQLALAADQTNAYAAVRGQDVAGIMLRQAQAEAALARQADLSAFAMQVPDDVQHRTVYAFHLTGGR